MQYILTEEEYLELKGKGENEFEKKYRELTDELTAFITQSEVNLYNDPRAMGEILDIRIPAHKLNGRLLEAFKFRINGVRRGQSPRI